jgi:cytochrome c-type biogenesis protein CcmH
VRARLAAAVLAALALLAPLGPLAPAAPAAESPPSLAQIEEEVMCPVCGTLLQLAEAPQAQREKAFIARLIAEGRSEEQIKDALVAEYGEEVLALPEGSGFNLSAYLVPIVAFLLAAAALAVGILRWRRAGGGHPGGDSAGGPSRLTGEDSERLDADLARYDL